MYAGDTVTYFSAKDADEIGRTLTKDSNLVHDWLLDNNMFLLLLLFFSALRKDRMCTFCN